VSAAEPKSDELFARKNLVAWCIVPFDSKKRGPEERAAMLEKLGFSKFAYDYRAEHIPTFEAEFEALKRHHIELTAWWFPTVLNDEARMTLALFEKHKLTPQLWVTGGGEPTKSEQEQQQRVRDEAARIRPIAEAAGKIGCKVALYNHGGWFGEPENQLAVIRELNLPNVGIVYNQHHGHDHIDRFAELLQKMKPHLYVLNLNGMVKQGDRQGQKILQLSEGDLDLKLLKVVRDSGYTGPIGILGHTSDDAEERLHDNLDGLDWLLPQLKGQPAGPKPKMRTPVPVAAVPPAAQRPNANVPRLVDGKFGKALDGKSGGVYVAGREEFRRFPLTVECWTKQTDKAPYNILVAHELKSSGTHWELFSMAGTGNLTAYMPGFVPDHCHSNAAICDGKWHHVAMIVETERIRLFVDGQQVASQPQQRSDLESVPGDLALASLVDQQIGCTGLLDEVRITNGMRLINSIPSKPFEVEETTQALWHLDELVDQKRFDDATKKNPALIDRSALPKSTTAQRTKVEGHWGEDALGFRWTEDDSRDDRFGEMDTGPFFSGSITGHGGTVYKGIVVRLGDRRQASICYDTELMRASAGWNGFLQFDPARYGIIVPPRTDGKPTFTTPVLVGWSRTDNFADFRAENRYGTLPKTQAHYEGLYRHGQRVVLKFSIGDEKNAAADNAARTFVLEAPWLEQSNGISVISRTLQVGPSKTPLSMLVTGSRSQVRIVQSGEIASLRTGSDGRQILVIPAREKTVTLKLLVATTAVDEAEFDALAASSPAAEDLDKLIKPGSTIWGEPLVTTGEVSSGGGPLAVDTLTLPFENPFKALMFCGGHDFLPDGRAVVCTLHGDVWLVDGIDETLKHITWQRFATGLFQALGLKVVKSSSGAAAIYVVGRDQITRLHDLNNDGEADFYENFNNDAAVTLNGHEYVTSLETDRAGSFYYIKGNCDSATPHDGCLLRVTPDGSKLDVFATGFRNSNGIGIGPNDEITAAPQEGEWTPASALFAVRQGGFYGGTMSHHRPTTPTDFERPISWFPRLADNSSGGQVWVPQNQWGPLANRLLLLSYGQCKIRLMLQEPLATSESSASSTNSLPAVALKRSPLITTNGGSTELPASFSSGIHRGRFNARDGHLYLTGLKGWVTSAVNDGCFQRVRYTGKPLDVLLGMKTYRNGVALTFSRPLDRQKVEEIDNYQVEVWNYHWSSGYGSPDLKPSLPGQVGRDPVEPKSVTLLDDDRTVFIEIPDLKPVDQMGVGYSLQSADGKLIEQTAYLTLNGIPDQILPESQIHRSQADVERAELLARLSPGVAQKSSDNTVATRRMLAVTAGPAAAAAQTLAGYLRVPATDSYRFSTATANGATLEVDGQTYPIGQQPVTIRLNKGILPFRLRLTGTQRDVPFRLLWESDKFPREAIPATALYHETADHETAEHETVAGPQMQLATGRSLFAEKRCYTCHTGDSETDARATAVERLRQAPSLVGVGSRLSEDWLREWILNPAHLRADATMPRLVSASDGATLDHLVAYLKSLNDSSDIPSNRNTQSKTSSVESKETPLEQGARLYERLGCIACHTFDATDPNPDWNRVSFHFIREKLTGTQLEQYLREPQRLHVGSQMPDFHLTDDESKSLAAYLNENSKGRLQVVDRKAGDRSLGQKLFTDLRCSNCHQVSAKTAVTAANVKSAFVKEADRGCLAEAPTLGSKAPVFAWKEGRRESLLAFVKAKAAGAAVRPEAAGGHVSRLITSLRCTACHARDATSASWPEIVAEEGSGKMLDAVPQLTWVGEKLQGPWIEKMIKGEISHKPRPWIVARMPSFPAYASLIAHGLADEHGVPFAESLPVDLDPVQIEKGRQLTLRDGGLDCRQCHAIGKDKPRGDAATQLALGINFVQTRDRLRPEFALRQLFDPPRYDIGSRMPRFAPDLRTTAVKQIEGGDARQQFEALKQFVWSLKSED